MLFIRLSVQLRALAWAVVLVAASSVVAETTPAAPPALPLYPDQTPSVYATARAAAGEPSAQVAQPMVEPVTPASFEAPPVAAPVKPAAAAPIAHDPRRLAPHRNRGLPYSRERDQAVDATRPLPSFSLPLDSIYTTVTALAVVVGLFLLSAWVVRRGAKKSSTVLPEDVVSVLGRVPLASRQFAQLVRVGNKLVLLSVTQAGAEPLTEITDPIEIDRLLGLCHQQSAHSSTAEFDQVFRQLAEETAPDGFLGNEAPRLDARFAAATATATATDAFAAYRGGANRG